MFKNSKNSIKSLKNNFVMNQQSDGQRWMDGQTGKKWLKESKKKCMNDLKSFKNIKNVLKFVEIPF